MGNLLRIFLTRNVPLKVVCAHTKFLRRNPLRESDPLKEILLGQRQCVHTPLRGVCSNIMCVHTDGEDTKWQVAP